MVYRLVRGRFHHQRGFSMCPCVWRDKSGIGLPAGLPVAPDAIIDQFSEVPDLVENAVLV